MLEIKQTNDVFYACTSSRVLADVLLIDAARSLRLCMNGDIDLSVVIDGDTIEATLKREHYTLKQYGELRDAAFKKLEGLRDANTKADKTR